MNCPKCKSALVTFEIDGIELEECRKCEGMWFDKNELKQVMDEIDSDLNWMDFNIWKHINKFNVQKTKYNCPKCNAKMEVFNYDNSGIEFDFCMSCDGVWLDSGEIQKLISVLEEELTSKDLGDYVESTIEKAKELFKDPERFISEWKDFKTILRLLQYRILSRSPKLNKILNTIQNNPLNK